MRGQSLRQASWHRHINGVNAPAPLRHWLTGNGSLTAKLKAHSRSFRVQRLHQYSALCLHDEASAVGLVRRGRVWEREVLLRCDEVPVVFAHTVVPLAASASDWPLFNALGERSLGSTLFTDRLVRRGTLQFARLGPDHPLVQRACAALRQIGQEMVVPDGGRWHARRCLYRRHRGWLLVTEVFLPAVLKLVPPTAQPIMNQV